MSDAKAEKVDLATRQPIEEERVITEDDVEYGELEDGVNDQVEGGSA